MTEYKQLDLYAGVTSDDVLESIFDEALRSLLKREPRPEIEARFYPYAGLSSTIRLRKGRVHARVSDILAGSPREVLFALACILIAKLYRFKTPKAHERIYRRHTLDPSVLEASHNTRRKRGYKITTSSSGKVYDLAKLFDALNTRYFAGSLAQPQLSWSRRQTRRILGHHDNVHRTIVISSTLDNPQIPQFVVEYVLYHEMLHVKHPPRVVAGRSSYHGPAFRADERKFERFAKAMEWLERIASPTRSKTRRRRLF